MTERHTGQSMPTVAEAEAEFEADAALLRDRLGAVPPELRTHPLHGADDWINAAVIKHFAGPRDEAAGRDYYDLRVLAELVLAGSAFATGCGNGGRPAMVLALRAAITALQNTPEVEDSMLKPLFTLYDALLDLTRGCTHPALTAEEGRSGRTRYRVDQVAFQFHCVLARRLLIRTGLSAGEATKAVVRRGQAAAALVGLSARRSGDGSGRVLSVDRIAKWEQREGAKWRRDSAISEGLARAEGRFDRMVRTGAPVGLLREFALNLVDKSQFAHLENR